MDKTHGLTFTQAWSTTNALRTQIELENQIAKGLKLDATTTLHPEKSSKSVVLGAAYKQPGLHSRALLDVFKVRLLFLRFSPPRRLTTFPIHSIGPHLYRRHRTGP